MISSDSIRSLHERYPGNGPRYTSYPTPLELSPSFTASDALSLIRTSNEALVPNPLSLYFHLSLYRGLCFYCDCHRIVNKNQNHAARYLDTIKREVELVSAYVDNDRRVVQLHLGGGTPSFYSIAQLGDLLASVRNCFRLSDADDRDYFLEIDPRTVDERYIGELTSLGFNRISIGVQDFDDAVQTAIHRRRDGVHVERLIAAARTAGIDSINLNLIYGLPRQSLQTFSTTLARTIDLAPDRISIYQYAHMPERFHAQQWILSEDLPDRNLRLDLECAAIDALISAGYQHIGMGHYVTPDDPLINALREGSIDRNFMGYSTNADCDLLGFGFSAISDIGNGMYQNEKSLDAYHADVDQGRLTMRRGLRRNRDDLIRQSVIRQIVCQGQIDLQDFHLKTGVGFSTYFSFEQTAVVQMTRDGLLESDRSAIRVTSLGRFLLHDIACVFDHYRENAAQSCSIVPLANPNVMGKTERR